MKKNIIKRALIGFPIGVSIGIAITIIISLIIAKGEYFPCVPSFVEEIGSEINAMILQTILVGLLGSVFSVSAIIWKIDNWSIAKQTAIYASITSTFMLSIAYVLHWMERSLKGFIVYTIIFILIFSLIWLVQYFVWKVQINKINSKL